MRLKYLPLTVRSLAVLRIAILMTENVFSYKKVASKILSAMWVNFQNNLSFLMDIFFLLTSFSPSLTFVRPPAFALKRTRKHIQSVTKQTVGTQSPQPVPHTHSQPGLRLLEQAIYDSVDGRGTFCQVTERRSSYWLAKANPGARALRLASFEVAERRISPYSRLLFWPGQGRTAALCQS